MVILVRVLIYIIFFSLSYQSFASESIYAKSYRFGSERRSGDGKPFIYPSSNLPEYDVSAKNLEQDINVKLFVKQLSDSVLATLVFHNNSVQSYFIPKLYYPMQLEDGKGRTRDALCGEKFIVTSKNIRLDYLSGSCPFDFSPKISDWIEIQPTQSISIEINLSDMYAFLPNDNSYAIKTFDYKIVNRNWFVLQNINEIFLSLTEKKVECMFDIESNSDGMCERNYSEGEMYSFLINSISVDNNDSAYVSSGEVRVHIDGHTVRSPY